MLLLVITGCQVDSFVDFCMSCTAEPLLQCSDIKYQFVDYYLKDCSYIDQLKCIHTLTDAMN